MELQPICAGEGEVVVMWYGSFTTIPAPHTNVQDTFDEVFDTVCHRKKFGKSNKVIGKFTKQGKNGAKGRKTREYFTERVAKERRAGLKVSRASNKGNVHLCEDDSCETPTRPDQTVLKPVHVTKCYCGSSIHTFQPLCDECTYYGKIDFDGFRSNHDDDGNCVKALRDRFGNQFADALEDLPSQCYDCGSYGSCPC